ncbi:unnamed protein product [Durusdinium trenchii]|uniref:Uncharacterized protein n=1 Tax=Durusdinium trenchii TaxID=1381693 RepID=A0ABP0MP24_9DINO
MLNAVLRSCVFASSRIGRSSILIGRMQRIPVLPLGRRSFTSIPGTFTGRHPPTSAVSVALRPWRSRWSAGRAMSVSPRVDLLIVFFVFSQLRAAQAQAQDVADHALPSQEGL